MKKIEFSEKYKLMICFTHSTLVMYQKSISSHPKMSVGEFMKANREVLERVAEEAKNIFSYELSHNQLSKGSYSYLSSEYHPQSIKNTLAYKPEKV